jgi:hypothetical protein
MVHSLLSAAADAGTHKQAMTLTGFTAERNELYIGCEVLKAVVMKSYVF